MSHEIESTDRAAYGSKPAWHRLGTVYGRPMTADEAIKEIGFQVQCEAITLPGTNIPIPGMYIVTRDDLAFDNPARALATVGARYEPIQNEQLVDLVAAFCGEANARIESAFTMQGGRKAVVAATLNNSGVVRGGGGTEEMVFNIWGRTSHDGQWFTGLRRAAGLPVCMNTVRAAMQEASNEIAIRHTAGGQAAIANVKEAVAGSVAYFANLVAAAGYLADTPATGEVQRQFLSRLFPMPAPVKAGASDAAAKSAERAKRATEKARAAVEAAFTDFTGPAGEPTRRGTLWGLTQAAAGLAEWSGRVRVAGGEEEAAPDKVAEVRLLSLLDGSLGQAVDAPYTAALQTLRAV